MVGRLVSASIVKELGPVLTGLMVAGRVGSGIAAELGSMMVTDQIAALTRARNGPDPETRRAQNPRRAASWCRSLRWWPAAIGMVGGWIVTVGVLAGGFVGVLELGRAGALHPGRLDGSDQAVFPRALPSSASAATSGCGRRGGTQGVGRATTNAVVASSVAVIAVDYLVTQVLIVLMY